MRPRSTLVALAAGVVPVTLTAGSAGLAAAGVEPGVTPNPVAAPATSAPATAQYPVGTAANGCRPRVPPVGVPWYECSS